MRPVHCTRLAILLALAFVGIPVLAFDIDSNLSACGAESSTSCRNSI
jgi:hypothetical protein